MKEKCILYDRDCIDCGECEFCDLNPSKLCNNCGKCLDMTGKGYATIKIDKIVYNGESGNFEITDDDTHRQHHEHSCDCGCDDCED